MKELIAKLISKETNIHTDEIINLIENPPNPELGDYAFPCFSLAKTFKKNPVDIAKELSAKIKSKEFEKIECKGPYLNFFINRAVLAENVISEVLKKKDKYGSTQIGKGKTLLIDLSAPNIAKPFGIGHLRSTIIGSSIGNLAKFNGYNVVKINYLGDWGTQFGKLIVGYKKFKDKEKLKKDPLAHLQELYVKINSMPELEDQARLEFKKLEEGDKQNLLLWKKFKQLSLKEFKKIYNLLGVKFDVTSGESFYNTKMNVVVDELKNKGLLVESDGAQIVDLNNFNLGVCLIKKKDGATLYATRDITAAIDRYNNYHFDTMVYEVGSEQSLHFKQFFKVLELMGYKWANDCIHVDHGLYLDSDGKKFSTRKGKTVMMMDILNETIKLAGEEISKREKLSDKELSDRAKKIALAAILYGDLKNHRSSSVVFDIERFLSFEGNTGPYLLYTYARSRSILSKAKYSRKKFNYPSLDDKEKALLIKIKQFNDVVVHAYSGFAPNLIANYAYELAQLFNEFYHSSQVIGSEQEQFRLALVDAASQVLKNSLSLLGISVIEKM